MQSGNGKTYWIDEFQIDPTGLRIIGASGEFSVEPKIMQVLSLLAEAQGETVLRETFKDRIWEAEYGSDESLTRAISILRKTFRKSSRQRAIIETVPRTGYRLLGNISTNPVPHKDKVHKPLTSSHRESAISVVRQGWSGRYATVILASLVLIFGVASALTWQDQPRLSDRTNVSRNLVQIAPFDPINEDQIAARVSAGLGSQMVSTLATQGISTSFDRPNLSVIPEFEVSGDVLVQAERLRATVRLKDYVSGQIIWTEVVESETSDDLNFGLGLTIKTASILDCLKSWRTGRYPNSAETLQLYARFCEAYEMRSSKDFSALTEPIYLSEPDNPMALSLHGWAIRNQARHHGHMVVADSEISLEQANSLFSRALELRPDLPVANVYYSLIDQADAGMATYNSLLSDAIVRNDLPEDLYEEYANLLRRTGRLHEAIWIYRRMAEFDATNPLTLGRLGWMYAVDGDFRQSERYFAQAEAIDPDSVELLMRRRQVELWLKDEDSLRSLLENWPINESIDTTQDEQCRKAYIRQMLSDERDTSRLLAECPEQDAMWTARMFIGMGDIDSAYDIIEDYDWAREPNYAIFFFYPDMQGFRQDARFWPLMDKLGLSEFWRETGEWPDFCKTENHGSHCGADT